MARKAGPNSQPLKINRQHSRRLRLLQYRAGPGHRHLLLLQQDLGKPISGDLGLGATFLRTTSTHAQEGPWEGKSLAQRVCPWHVVV